MGEFFYRTSSPIPTYFPNYPLSHTHIEYFRYLEREKVLSFVPYDNYVPFLLCADISVTGIELNHGFPCSGFVISYAGVKIGIVSDTNLRLKEETVNALEYCDYLFADCFSENYEQVKLVYEECGIASPDLSKEWFHMTFDEARKLQEMTHSKKVVSVHMSRFVAPHAELVDRYQREDFVVGFDGLILNFNKHTQVIT